MGKPVKVSDLMKELNLPKNSKFIGFVVHLPNSDEFLMNFSEDRSSSELIQGGYIWAKIPDFAYAFNSQREAEKFTKDYGKDSLVACLFDVGDQYLLQPV